jgi:hypothetical protein
MSRGDPLPPLPSEPVPGLYRHYKGNLYEVVGLVRHSEELAPYVLYRPLDERRQPVEGTLWVRPHRMWSEPVEHAGRVTPRFAPVAA